MNRLQPIITCLIVTTVFAATFNPDECKTTKNCVGVPEGCFNDGIGSCDFVWSYKKVGDDKVEIEAFTKGDDQYVAVGFSDDRQMGDDHVTACLKDEAGAPLSVQSVNKGKSNSKAEIQDAKIIDFTAADGTLYCKFQQNVNKGGNGQSDLSVPRHLLMAKGGTNGAGVGYHTGGTQSTAEAHNLLKRTPAEIEEAKKKAAEKEIENPTGPANKTVPVIVEDEPVKKQETGTGPFALTSGTKFLFIKYHGVAMLFGWLGFLFTGVFSARYLRNLWPNTTVGGLRIWFHIHRIMNMIGVVLVVLGGILIFVAKDLTWAGPDASMDQSYNLSPGAIHSLLGVIAVLLALLQPFGALLRCKPDHSKRSIFNFFHRSFGLLAVILAIACVIIAVFYFKSMWYTSTYSYLTIILFLVIAVVIVVVQEIVKFKEENEQQRIVAIEMRNRSKSQVPSDSYYFRERQAHSDRHKRATVFLFLIFVLVGFVAATFLAYFVLA